MIKKIDFNELVALTANNKHYLSLLKKKEGIDIIPFNEPVEMLENILKAKKDLTEHELKCKFIKDEEKNIFLSKNWFKTDTSQVKIGGYVNDELVAVLTLALDVAKHQYKTVTFVTLVNEKQVLDAMVNFFIEEYCPKTLILALDTRFYTVDGATDSETPVSYYYHPDTQVMFSKSYSPTFVKSTYPDLKNPSVASLLANEGYKIFFDAGKSIRTINNPDGSDFLYYFPKDKEEKIVQLYKDGVAMREIGIRVDEDQRIIKKILESRQVEIDSTKKKEYRPTEEFSNRVDKMYLIDKMMIKDIAAALGVDRHTITRYLDRNDITKRSRTFNDEEKTQIAKMYVEDYLSMYDIADEFECSAVKIRTALVEKNVVIRQQENNIPSDSMITRFMEEHLNQKKTVKDFCAEHNFHHGTVHELLKERGFNLIREKYNADDKQMFFDLYTKDNNTLKNICKEHGICGKTLSTILNEIEAGVTAKNRFVSYGEMEIRNFLDENNIEYEGNSKILGNRELDIYIPQHNLAIEYNGLFWHREGTVEVANVNYGGKAPDYHLYKTERAEEKGIYLIQIFENEFLENKEMIFNKLRYFFGLQNDSIAVRGSDVTVKQIDTLQKNEFLNAHHIQGQDYSQLKYGAFYQNELVAVMTFNKKDDTHILNRFAMNTAYRVHGGFDKILKFAARDTNMTKVVSYGDRRWVNKAKNIYISNGFELVSTSPPSYYYVDLAEMRLMHKNNWKKDNIIFRYPQFEGSTLKEHEMMAELGYDRIWNCGLLKYEKTL